MRIIGYDPNGIPRVWAEDDFEQTAYGFAKEQALAYQRRRPDTGPANNLSFKDSADAEVEIFLALDR